MLELNYLSMAVSNLIQESDTLRQLSRLISEYKIAKEMINNDLTTFTVIVSALMLFFTVIISFIIPRGVNALIKNKLKKYKEEVNLEIQNLNSKQSEALIILFQTNMRAVRSLYENNHTDPNWKFIWSVRYVQATYDLLELTYSEKLKSDLLIRIEIAERDLSRIPDDKLPNFHKFENKEGIIDSIKKLSLNNDPAIKSKSNDLLKKVYELGLS